MEVIAVAFWLCVNVGLAFVLLWLLCVRPSVTGRGTYVRREYEADTPVQYAGKDKPGLRFSGWTLQLLSCLLNSLFGENVLLSLFIRIAGLHRLRNLIIPDEPTFVPSVELEGASAQTEAGPDQAKNLLDLKEADYHGFAFKGISCFVKAYRSGVATPVEVAEHILQAMHKAQAYKPPLCAIVQSSETEVRKMASAATQRYQAGKPLSVLDGVPVCIKEQYQVMPYHHRAGTVFLGDEEETKSEATLVVRLRAAGAVIIGVSNMHELGLGITGCNPNRHHGTPCNPYQPGHCTGGSSSGCAAAVASGLCPLSFGADGGGSIRIPSSFCGIVGLKATYGRFSCHGVLPVTYSHGALGPICTSVKDAALSYAMLAGPDPAYPIGMDQPNISLAGMFSPDIKHMKLGVFWDFFKHCDEEVFERCEAVVRALENSGVEVISMELPEMEEAMVAHNLCLISEMRNFLEPYLASQGTLMNPETKCVLALASNLTASDFIQANRQRTRTMRFMQSAFQKVHCILTPGTAITAPKMQENDPVHGFIDLKIQGQAMRFAHLANLTGLPALVVPVGYSKQGLPIGLQVMGSWWAEETVLRVGRKVEEICGERRKPKVYFDLLPDT
uniref:uncharacterized protein n=1 Tax=Myxine glutinosa TaxID=7769 RepID=UPI00358EC153